jgi:uncharacterized protein (TIGR03066 family)
MTARLLVLPVVVVAMFGFVGCSEPDMAPVADEKQATPAEKPNADLPQAPEPRAKKTTAELLVGTWKMIKLQDVDVNPQLDIQIEFNRDGKFIVQIIEPKNGIQMSKGSYTLKGKTLRRTSVSGADQPERSWDVTIEVITNDELIIVAGSMQDLERNTYKRLGKE